MSERWSACQVSVEDKGKKNSHAPYKPMSISPPVSRKKLRGANEIIRYSGRARATALDRTGLDWIGLDWTASALPSSSPQSPAPPDHQPAGGDDSTTDLGDTQLLHLHDARSTQSTPSRTGHEICTHPDTHAHTERERGTGRATTIVADLF
jgi:hypothetical protein